jgi:predicted RNA-binding protein YlxR (DUF448 family)
MATALPPAQHNQTDATPELGRRCLASGEIKPKDDLIRFVVAPGQVMVPDLAGNLPGRGFWVSADREAIDTAARKNLFAKAAKDKIKTDPKLADCVADLLRKRCLEWIGLSRSAGIAVLGQPQVEAALKSNKIDLLLLAEDAAINGLEKMGTKIDSARSFTRNELGKALGHDQIVYAGLKSHSITAKLRGMLAHLEKIEHKHHLSCDTDSGKQ